MPWFSKHLSFTARPTQLLLNIFWMWLDGITCQAFTFTCKQGFHRSVSHSKASLLCNNKHHPSLQVWSIMHTWRLGLATRRRSIKYTCFNRLSYSVVHGKAAVSAKMLNWEKRPFSFFSPSRIYRYCIFQYHFFA